MMKVSLIIPTYNRKEALLETLDALEQLDFPVDQWEAIVVDDGSTDDTEAVIAARMSVSSFSLRYLQQSNAGPSVARNRGAAAACGEFLIFIDNDIIVQPDFVRSHLEALTAHPHSWILGRVIHPPELRKTPFGRYRDDLFESFYRSHPPHTLSETEGMTTQNISLPSADFKKLGGFDESFTIASSEDWELAQRAKAIEIRILYHPGIVGLHNDWAISLERFCERQRLYSLSDVLLFIKLGDNCLRAHLVRENSPIEWRKDGPKVTVKKILKEMLSTGAGKKMICGCSGIVEKLFPDSQMSHRFYNLAIAIAIFSGVRAGFKQYGLSTASDTLTVDNTCSNTPQVSPTGQ